MNNFKTKFYIADTASALRVDIYYHNKSMEFFDNKTIFYNGNLEAIENTNLFKAVSDIKENIASPN